MDFGNFITADSLNMLLYDQILDTNICSSILVPATYSYTVNSDTAVLLQYSISKEYLSS